MRKLPWLERRTANHALRIPVPKRLWQPLDRAVIRIALGSADRRQALHLYHSVVADVRALFADLEHALDRDPKRDLKADLKQFLAAVRTRIRAALAHAGNQIVLPSANGRTARGGANVYARAYVQAGEVWYTRGGWDAAGASRACTFGWPHSENVIAAPALDLDPRGRALHPVTLRELFDAYLRDKGHERGWDPNDKAAGALGTYLGYFHAAAEFLGPDRDIRTIRRSELRAYAALLAQLPVNRHVKPETRELSMQDAARVAAELGLETLSPVTINNYLTVLAASFDYAEREQMILSSPARKLPRPAFDPDERKRSAYDLGRLTTLFHAPQYLALPRDTFAFWGPLVALWGGLRMGEIVALRITDIQLLEGIYVIVVRRAAIRPDGTRAPDKRVKTDASERIVPIHPELLKMGFIEFWERRLALRAERVFSDIPVDAKTLSLASQRFRRFAEEIGIYTRHNVFHSFRHNFRTALRRTDVRLDIQYALGGWESDVRKSHRTRADAGLNEIGERYGDFPASVLFRAIRKITYPGLDLKHLYSAAARARFATYVERGGKGRRNAWPRTIHKTWFQLPGQSLLFASKRGGRGTPRASHGSQSTAPSGELRRARSIDVMDAATVPKARSEGPIYPRESGLSRLPIGSAAEADSRIEENMARRRDDALWQACKKLPQDYTPYGEEPRWADPHALYPDCSSGCRFFVPLHVRAGEYPVRPAYEGADLDWGVCINCASHRCGLLMFEHQGCAHFEPEEPDRSWRHALSDGC